MEEAHKEFNLRVAEDGVTVLLDCDIATDELDELVAAISNELEALGIKDPPDQEQLKEQLRHAAEEDPHLVDFVLIEGKPPVPLLKVTEDGLAVLLNCDVTTDELDEIVTAIGNELKELGIKDPPDQKQLKKQLQLVAKGNPHLVDFILIKGEPPVPPQPGRVEWDGDFFNTGFVADKKTGKVDYREKKAHESVFKDALLGHQIPAKEGKDGRDVFGDRSLLKNL